MWWTGTTPPTEAPPRFTWFSTRAARFSTTTTTTTVPLLVENNVFDPQEVDRDYEDFPKPIAAPEIIVKKEVEMEQTMVDPAEPVDLNKGSGSFVDSDAQMSLGQVPEEAHNFPEPIELQPSYPEGPKSSLTKVFIPGPRGKGARTCCSCCGRPGNKILQYPPQSAALQMPQPGLFAQQDQAAYPQSQGCGCQPVNCCPPPQPCCMPQVPTCCAPPPPPPQPCCAPQPQICCQPAPPITPCCPQPIIPPCQRACPACPCRRRMALSIRRLKRQSLFGSCQQCSASGEPYRRAFSFPFRAKRSPADDVLKFFGFAPKSESACGQCNGSAGRIAGRRKRQAGCSETSACTRRKREAEHVRVKRTNESGCRACNNLGQLFARSKRDANCQQCDANQLQQNFRAKRSPDFGCPCANENSPNIGASLFGRFRREIGQCDTTCCDFSACPNEATFERKY
ncbi:unnamed protein product, partial [Mesorhabditis spiculigera]